MTSTLTPTDSASIISGLREQIKANASILFPHGPKITPQFAYDIIITTCTTNEKVKPQYQALLTYASGALANNNLKDTIAAKSAPSENLVGALEGLLHVIALALEKFQEKLFKQPTAPEGFEDGMVDHALIVGKGWKGMWKS